MAHHVPAPRVNDGDELSRLAELIDVVVGIASNDFSRRAHVGDGRALLDGLAAGLNMLAEEVGRQARREAEYRVRLVRAERLAAVGQLAAGVAHEVNNPAAFVLLNLLTLDERLAAAGARGLTGPELAEALDLVRDTRTGVERIVALVRDLRQFSRIDDERFQPVALADVVEQAAKLVHAELAYRARLVVDCTPDLRVRGDAARLVQLLTNLLMNAAHAVPEGAPALHAVTVAARRDGATVVVEVRDTGRGIPPEVESHLFEPFFSTKPREQGLGLGLTIAAGIARQHGGDLRLARTSPDGTTFEVTLPATPVPAVVDSPAPTASAARPIEAPRRRVLIVDDEPMLLATYERLLGRHFDLTTAGSGRAALTLLAADAAWDAVVCDLMMPDVDGAAVYEWIEAHRPELARRTLFCSGGAFTPRGFAFVERIGDRLLNKPVLPRDLVAAVERMWASEQAGSRA